MESTDIISIKELSEHEYWSLFKQIAFFNRPHLEYIEKNLASVKAPLATKTIGSLLVFKRTSKGRQIILDGEMWQLEEFERGVLAPVLLSYNDLPPAIKQCFSYCDVFPKDYNIEEDELIKLLLALVGDDGLATRLIHEIPKEIEIQ